MFIRVANQRRRRVLTCKKRLRSVWGQPPQNGSADPNWCNACPHDAVLKAIFEHFGIQARLVSIQSLLTQDFDRYTAANGRVSNWERTSNLCAALKCESNQRYSRSVLVPRFWGYIIRTKIPVNFKASITNSEIQDKEQKNTKLHVRVSQNQFPPSKIQFSHAAFSSKLYLNKTKISISPCFSINQALHRDLSHNVSWQAHNVQTNPI